MFAWPDCFALAAAAHADTLEVKVPFAFIVGSQQMPAGDVSDRARLVDAVVRDADSR